MGRFVSLALAALGALQVLGVIAEDIPTCVPGCSNELRGQFGKLGCGNAEDADCLCSNANFSYGVRDCGAHCGANNTNVRQYLGEGFCAGRLPALSDSATALSDTASSSQPTPGTTSPTPTPTPASATSTSPSVTVASTTTGSTAGASPTHPETSGTPAAPTPSAAAADSTSSGLSQASVAGIGVGVAALVIALAVVVVCFLWRGRKRKPHQSIEISKPLPRSGRTYAARDPGSFEKFGNDIEMTSNRYEDMVPRQQPRTMV